MGQRKSNKPLQAEKVLRVLEYLRQNTDEKHPITQIKLRDEFPDCFARSSRTATNEMINGFAHALNFDQNGELLPEDEWQIVFDEFKKTYRWDYDESDEDQEDAPANGRMSVHHLHYQPVFSGDEIDRLIEGVLFSKTLNEKTAKRIVKKIERHLTNRFYRQKYKDIHKVCEPTLLDRSRMDENISAIRQAIGENRRIEFCFNGYNRRKVLAQAGEPYTASPYYIVANGGRYYLIGSPDYKNTMYIWRIDLMTDVRLTEKARVPKREVESLPAKWTDDFQLSHLNMSYDKPETIRLRIREDNGGEPPYTFLHDWFGDTFRCVGKDEVLVECSPFGMINWAMQYSGRVEVLAPEKVREAVKDRVRKMNEKYGI